MQGLAADKTIAVIGAGTMGAGIAQVAAAFGHRVLLFDQAEGAAQKGIERTAKGLDKLIERGKLTSDDRDQLIARIEAVASLDALSSAALVIEAVVEDLAIKQALFKKLESQRSAQTIFATNTSSISVTAIASALDDPTRVVGMHFFNPAPIMKLVEVVSGLQTNNEVAQVVHATATQWGKQAVHTKSTPGFIVNRVARPFYAEALRAFEEGAANVPTIDAIMCESGGFRMGPFALMDLIGNDINFAVTESVCQAYFGDQRFTPSLFQQEMIQAGLLGCKTGEGFYHYGEGADKPDVKSAQEAPAPSQMSIDGRAFTQDDLALMHGATTINAGSATLTCTDGRMATQRAADEQIDNLVLFDLALDYTNAGRIALAKADQTSDQAWQDAIGFWQQLGKQVSVIDDLPGMCVMRTVCMLANEGADAVNQGVCDVQAVDVAMQAGVNYPQGPMVWADAIGLDLVVRVLQHLQAVYGEDRYRVSPLLQRRLAANRNLL